MTPQLKEQELPLPFQTATNTFGRDLIAQIPFVSVLGIRFHQISLQQALHVLDKLVMTRIPRQVTFGNAYTVALCQSNSQLRNLINQSHISLADGMSIVWGARMLKLKIPERVAGPDMMKALCELSSKKNYRIFLLGSTPDNLYRLREVLTKTFPKISIVGTYSPPMCSMLSPEENQKIIGYMRATRPDILFVGLSFPKQEKWIAENLSELNVPLCLGVGAAFDFLSGRVPRAPEWLRKRGLEWLHRLICEPVRLWKRYLLGNAIFLTVLFNARVWHKIKTWYRHSPTHEHN